MEGVAGALVEENDGAVVVSVEVAQAIDWAVDFGRLVEEVRSSPGSESDKPKSDEGP